MDDPISSKPIQEFINIFRNHFSFVYNESSCSLIASYTHDEQEVDFAKEAQNDIPLVDSAMKVNGQFADASAKCESVDGSELSGETVLLSRGTKEETELKQVVNAPLAFALDRLATKFCSSKAYLQLEKCLRVTFDLIFFNNIKHE